MERCQRANAFTSLCSAGVGLYPLLVNSPFHYPLSMLLVEAPCTTFAIGNQPFYLIYRTFKQSSAGLNSGIIRLSAVVLVYHGLCFEGSGSESHEQIVLETSILSEFI